MKRWAIWVVVLYFLILVVLTGPVVVAAFYPSLKVRDAFGPLTALVYWLGVAVVVAAQAVMLTIPVERAEGRPTGRRSVLWTILASGLMMALLVTGAVLSIDEFFRKQYAGTNDAALPWVVLLLVWAGWSLLFHRASRGADAMDMVTRQCRYLLKGSILELLVAVPTHIVARTRDYCCAGFWTFLGIAFGLSVMLFSFGPAVFFLFVERWKRLHPQSRTEP